MVTYIDVDDPSQPIQGIDAIAASLVPDGSEVITACTIDEVDHAMSAQSGELLGVLDDLRHSLRVLAGALERQIATPETATASVRNILAMIPEFPDRTIRATS